jgi:hypothetical protein|tara:strand:+ start:274 stop:441 length:168 start_codon:yes stop_codon:yes gene_type:complete
MGKFRIVSTQIFVEWNDSPKLVRVDNDLPPEFDEWLAGIERERNCFEGSDEGEET